MLLHVAVFWVAPSQCCTMDRDSAYVWVNQHSLFSKEIYSNRKKNLGHHIMAMRPTLQETCVNARCLHLPAAAEA